MIKKLDRLILKTFIGPFIATFFIAFFVLMMQSLWKYVDDLVGKGLDLLTVGKFLWYASASMLTLAMPIAILISSIMTFGNLGERFELVAIKSSGISLLRFMMPLAWMAVLLCGITFMFANYVIPNANTKFKALYFSIMYKKPALDLQEGRFYTAIPGYAIKIGKKDDDQKTLHNVVIFEQQNSLQDNCIVADKGVMNFSPDERYLEFTLQNGCRYQERGNVFDTSTEFIKVEFKEYKKVFDIASLKMANPPDSMFKNDNRSMTVGQLNVVIDSLQYLRDSLTTQTETQLGNQLPSIKQPDSVWKKAMVSTEKLPKKLYPDSLQLNIHDNAISAVYNVKNSIQYNSSSMDQATFQIRENRVELHHKFALSFACLVLFFIGAPLGSIIRKGGMGMPLVIAIIFFLIFHLLNMFGEKFAKEGLASPWIGMWLPVWVLTPVGIFLTYKAMHDSQLFNKEMYVRFFRRIVSLFKKRNV